jgi:phosphopantothenoylcysteine synthetase/decarboxylase
VKLAESTILVTSGPTRAPIDEVRYLANRSTGRLGAAIAEEALARGASVLFVQGPESRRPRPRDAPARQRLHVHPVDTVSDLIQTLETLLTAEPVGAVVHAMAVLDYTPAEPAAGKIDSGAEELTLRLVPTPKVIRRIRNWAPGTLLVGFKLKAGCAEEELVQAAKTLAADAGAALVVANDIRRITDQFHPALLVDPEGRILARPDTREAIAAALLDWLESV